MSKFGWLVGVIVIAVIALLVMAKQGVFEPEPNQPVAKIEPPTPDSTAHESKREPIEHKPLSEALGVTEEDLIEVGGIKRPKRDVEPPVAIKESEQPSGTLPFPGRSPSLKGDENPQVAGLVKELMDPLGPKSAKSAFFKPEPFDLAEFQKNPEAYLNQIRPGRVFYPAQPGPNVKRLVSKTKPFQTILQGESVIVQVEASAGMPVTFYTPGIGEFPNKLTTYSVAADETGLASAVYTATTGTMGLTEILVASPVHSGQLAFRVNVELPK